jgi:hypothetical protein
VKPVPGLQERHNLYGSAIAVLFAQLLYQLVASADCCRYQTNLDCQCRIVSSGIWRLGVLPRQTCERSVKRSMQEDDQPCPTQVHHQDVGKRVFRRVTIQDQRWG